MSSSKIIPVGLLIAALVIAFQLPSVFAHDDGIADRSAPAVESSSTPEFSSAM